jgi:hypothetical protein
MKKNEKKGSSNTVDTNKKLEEFLNEIAIIRKYGKGPIERMIKYQERKKKEKDIEGFMRRKKNP